MGLWGVRCNFITKQQQASQNVLGVRGSQTGRKGSRSPGRREGTKGHREAMPCLGMGSEKLLEGGTLSWGGEDGCWGRRQRC